MRHGSGRVEPMRIVALESAGEPSSRPRPRFELYGSFALLMLAMGVLIGIVALLLKNRAAAVTASNLVAARWLLVLLGVVTGALALVCTRLFLRRSAEVPARRLSIDAQGVRFISLLGWSGSPAPARPARPSARRGARAPRALPARRSISPKHDRLLLDFSAPFGLTLLANGARQRLVLAVTTARDAVYFAARLDLSERHALRHLLSFASTISDDDAVLDATAPDGAPLELRAGDLENLVRTLLAVSPGALDRCLLSDTRGAPVTLDGADLRIGRRGFDLRAPLEWRAMLFQEPFGVVMPTSDHDKSPIAPPGGIMVYQGTWVRQGACEVVLVSLMSSVSAAAASEKPDDGTTPEVASAVLRDLRLMQATPEPPPPFELRVGIERMYMLRLRAALDRAPRPSKADRLSASAR